MRSAITLLCLTLLTSCNKNEVVNDNGGGVNIPSVASTQNAFSYSIDARQFTSERTVPLVFTYDSLAYALSVSGYSYGKATILIYADSLRYRSADLVFNTNQAFMFSLRGSPPDSITLTCSQFSGRISFALSGVASSLPKASVGRLVTSHKP